VAGETATTTGATIVTWAVADRVGSATDFAVTDTCAGFGTAGGAVYKPLAVTVPQAVPLHPVPTTLQVTAVLLAPVTVAVNC
jgi:hypothetical protein